jgi:hypothetical protein
MKTLFCSLVVLFSLSVPVYADQASDAVLQDKIDQLFIVGQKKNEANRSVSNETIESGAQKADANN